MSDPWPKSISFMAFLCMGVWGCMTGADLGLPGVPFSVSKNEIKIFNKGI